MTAAAKFMFDEDFAPGGDKPTITVVEHERRSADAEAVAHRKGFEAGQTQARRRPAERIARALTQIADSMARLNAALTGIEARLETEAVQVAVAVARKLSPELVGARAARRNLRAGQRSVPPVGGDAADRHSHRRRHFRRDQGKARRDRAPARLRRTPDRADADANVAPGDCRIEWADGGVTRDTAATLATIEDVVGRYIAARATARTDISN